MLNTNYCTPLDKKPSNNTEWGRQTLLICKFPFSFKYIRFDSLNKRLKKNLPDRLKNWSDMSDLPQKIGKSCVKESSKACSVLFFFTTSCLCGLLFLNMNTRTIPQFPTWSGFKLGNLGKNFVKNYLSSQLGAYVIARFTKTLYNLPDTNNKICRVRINIRWKHGQHLY